MTWKSIVGEPSPPKRPTKDYRGTLGRPIRLTVNSFEVNVKERNLVLYHYDVTIKDYQDKEDLPKRKKLSIFEKMKEDFPLVFKTPIAYDSMKNAYSTKLIPQLKKAVTYEVYLRPDTGAPPGNKPAAVAAATAPAPTPAPDPDPAPTGGKKGKGKGKGKGKKKEPELAGVTEVMEDERPKRHKYKVSIVNVNRACLGDLFDAMRFSSNAPKELPTLPIQMFEVMFRHYRAVRYVQVANRSFFSLNQEFAENSNIGGGKEGVTGFFGSLRPAAWKDGSILLTLDMAHTAFYKEQSILDFIKENEDLSDQDFGAPFNLYLSKKIEKSLKGLKLRVIHARRTYKFLRILEKGADRQTFPLQSESGSKEISVQQYMQQQYSITLRFPRLNCIQVGNPEKRVYLPMELCKIDKGQRVMKKLSDKEVATFIRSTAVDPQTRLRQIHSVAHKNEFNKDPMLQSLGFTISDMPLRIEGRVLPPPSLTMNKQRFEPRLGVWDVRDKTFHTCAPPLTVWAVINYDAGRTRRDAVMKFVRLLVSMGREKGMNVSEPFDVFEYRDRGDPSPIEDFKHYKKMKPDIQLLLCILPGRRYYGAIKKAGDTEEMIMTQCVQGMNVFKCQPQTVGNILLKINAKLGGVNNIVTGHPQYKTGLLSFAEPFLIMGADVNHPPAGNKENIPSLAAVVGSYDMHATKYSVERRVQSQRTEVIVDLTEITMNLLKNFYKKTTFKPKRIIMYRDGVSESQFKEVLASEMMAMRKACERLPGDYKPGITFICVQKRHHTRLFCDERDGVGRSKNVPPGTIVDRDITHPTEIDFYLCSHQGIQGTSKPTHYHILWDDNDLPINELQMLTYKLCHVYSRCSRAVSIPTPVYYAHLAAFRAKVYVQEILGTGSDTASTISGGTENSEAQIEIKRTAEVRIDNSFASKLHYI